MKSTLYNTELGWYWQLCIGATEERTLWVLHVRFPKVSIERCAIDVWCGGISVERYPAKKGTPIFDAVARTPKEWVGMTESQRARGPWRNECG